MDRIRLALVALLATAACGPAPEPPALNAQQQADAESDAFHAADPCFWLETTRDGSRISRSMPPGDCMAMEPAAVMHGIWYDGFEERGFVPNATTAPTRRVFSRRRDDPEFDTSLWLDRAEAERAARNARSGPGTRTVLITFVGRRAKPYRYRSGGRGDALIVVDRLLTWREIGAIEDFVDCRDYPQLIGHGPPCAPGTEPPAG